MGFAEINKEKFVCATSLTNYIVCKYFFFEAVTFLQHPKLIIVHNLESRLSLLQIEFELD